MVAETVAGMIASARNQIENLSAEDLGNEIANGTPLLVDIREPEERIAAGSIPGSVSAPRGMLEFYADSTSPYHRPEFESDRRVVLFCASGGRSALAAQSLQRLGYSRVAHLDGGFKGWAAAGNQVESPHAQ